MTSNFYRLVTIVVLVFALSQMILVRKYENLNDSLQDALAKCVGITKVR